MIIGGRIGSKVSLQKTVTQQKNLVLEALKH